MDVKDIDAITHALTTGQHSPAKTEARAAWARIRHEIVGVNDSPAQPVLTEEQHKARHQQLHQSLDELVADWVGHTDSLPSVARVSSLMLWSLEQAKNPTPTRTR